VKQNGEVFFDTGMMVVLLKHVGKATVKAKLGFGEFFECERWERATK